MPLAKAFSGLGAKSLLDNKEKIHEALNAKLLKNKHIKSKETTLLDYTLYCFYSLKTYGTKYLYFIPLFELN